MSENTARAIAITEAACAAWVRNVEQRHSIAPTETERLAFKIGYATGWADAASLNLERHNAGELN